MNLSIVTQSSDSVVTVVVVAVARPYASITRQQQPMGRAG